MSPWFWRGRLSRIAFYRRHEPVAAPGQRFDVDRAICRVSQGFAQFVDGLVQALLVVHERAVGPKPPLEVLAGNNLAGVFEQRRQDLNRLFLHFQTDAVLGEVTGLGIELKNAESLLSREPSYWP